MHTNLCRTPGYIRIPYATTLKCVCHCCPKKKNPALDTFNYKDEYTGKLVLFIHTYSVIHRYLFMAETIFEHLKYQLDQN
jgi:hypothetical protein